MAATLKDISFSEGTRIILEANGKSDCEHGIDKIDGWREICKEMGFFEGRTPAREAYEDGYYSGTFGINKPKEKE